MKRCVALALLLGAAAVGCDAPPPPSGGAFHAEEPESVLLVGLDVSGSFQDFMFGSDGRAFRYTRMAIDKYFQSNMGSNARLVILQIGADGKAPLLWDGSPRSFRQTFSSASAFKDFVLARSSPAGSRIFQSIADAIEYLLETYPDPKTRFCSLIMTDMEDNVGDPGNRLVKAMSAYAKRGGVMGIFWISDQGLAETKRIMQASGVKGVRYRRIVADPPLPEWD